MKYQKIFTTNLKIVLLKKQVKQKELAKYLNITEVAFSRYMQGTRKLSFEFAVELCNYLDVSMDTMLKED